MMKLSARQQAILDYLQQHPGVLSSNTLVEQCQVSVQTIRKDFNDLNELGLVRRVHGGITLPSSQDNLPFANRDTLHSAAKQAIARQVASQLPEGCSLFLGIGTTPKYVAQALLDHPGLTLVTNNIQAALTLSLNPNATIHLAGGTLRAKDKDTVGQATTDFYRRFHIQYGIFGVGGLGQNGALLDFSPDEAALSRTIIAQSEQCWLVADTSKLGRYAPVISGQLHEMSALFTEQPDAAIEALCQQHEVQLWTATSGFTV
ncbi:DeoR/GlpR family DNA-binding transcription regulator [Photobacterium sp. 1_MG-2023]|uniref:DeoR/GlpR family DNA-binding transcription regulator n=1 Tax=Photobacterium sp. 1_MG-2023 TaxID=3062646 RepID=UPI0026E3578E|nr:DeoR/GlpR family DNA-binding transcription regulator [Photobacterium sp. 1_MG-2023]MDO6708207.1 DeoR/GlpR family DNA-binding transcription regulator [Photobacterium sp. 1_MG-2023]